MPTKSALAALGLLPDPMRAVWNGMTARDRKFMARMSMVFDDVEVNEHQKISIHIHSKSWDELHHSQQIAIREAARRLAGWADAVGVSEVFKKQAA